MSVEQSIHNDDRSLQTVILPWPPPMAPSDCAEHRSRQAHGSIRFDAR